MRADWPEMELHLIGPLQTNKTKDALALFDVIHTVDRPKLVRSIAKESQALGRCPKLLIQVNTGEEDQKAGVLPSDVEALVQFTREENLPLAGFDCVSHRSKTPLRGISASSSGWPMNLICRGYRWECRAITRLPWSLGPLTFGSEVRFLAQDHP